MTPRFSRILVPTDFSVHADAALEYATRIAAACGGSLHLAHVLEEPFVAGIWASEIYLPEMTAVRARMIAEADQRLARCLSPSDRVQFHAHTHVLTGKADDCIVAFATAREMDLIVMGTHGRTGVAHLLMGSVAERVVRTAPCPVMTVRAPIAAAEVPVPVRVRKAVPAL